MAKLNLGFVEFELKREHGLVALTGAFLMNFVLTWGMFPIIFTGFATQQALATSITDAARERTLIQQAVKDLSVRQDGGFKLLGMSLVGMRIEGRRNARCEAIKNKNPDLADDLDSQIRRLQGDYLLQYGVPFETPPCPGERSP